MIKGLRKKGFLVYFLVETAFMLIILTLLTIFISNYLFAERFDLTEHLTWKLPVDLAISIIVAIVNWHLFGKSGLSKEH